MSTFRAFQTGLMAGQQQAKVRREDDARVKAAEAFGSGNYEGAVSSLMGVGLMDDADAYERAGARKKEAEQTEAYASAYKTGLGAGPAPNKKAAYQAVSQAAGSRGDFKTEMQFDQAIAQMDEQQASQFASSMEFLGQTALSLKQVPPEARGQAAMEILQNSPYANQQILAQIQQAAADGRITDDELDNFAMQTMSVADRVKLQREGSYTLGKDQVRFGPDNTVVASGPKSSPSEGRPPPSGYEYAPDGRSLMPIPGGPADKPASPLDVDPKVIQLEMQLSNKWAPIQSNFSDIRSQMERMQALGARKDSASDLGLIVSFTKMLDPGSVAREGEVKLTQQAAGLYDNAMMLIPRLQSGKTLLPDNVRQAYLDAAESMFQSYESAYERMAQDTQARANAYGLSADRIMLGYTPPPSEGGSGSGIFAAGAGVAPRPARQPAAPAVSARGAETGLEGLSDEQLEALLQQMEGAR